MFERGERLNVSQIVAASTLSRSAVAYHLKVLRAAGVLRCEKIGKDDFEGAQYEYGPIALTEVLP